MARVAARLASTSSASRERGTGPRRPAAGRGPAGLAHPARRSLRWCVAILLLVAAAAAAQPAPPRLTAPVNDFARVIDASSAQELDRRIRALQSATGDVVVVATVPTFQPYADIDEYAVKMFENGGQGIGVKGKDNAVLVVVAVQDRRVKIEVGYGLEEYIPDGFAGQTIREAMLPEFRSNAYGRGLVAGVTRIINRIADARGVDLQNVPREPIATAPSGGLPLSTIIFIAIILLIVMRNTRRRRRRWGGGPWSGWNSGVGPFGGGFGGGFGGFGGGFGGFGGGGGGGGFGGFGGGRSGGGGASGGW